MQGPDGGSSGSASNGRTRGVLEAARRRPLIGLLLIALASRLFFFVVALTSAARVEEWPAGAWHRGPAWVQPFARWDSGYYLDIALDGYGDRLELWAFHPGYPLLVRVLMTLVPGLGVEVAAFLISHAAFFAAVPLFYGFTRQVLGPSIAQRATIALTLFPTTFFLGAIYPESLFLVVLVLCLRAFHEEHWAAAGLWAAAANAIRPQGLFLAPAFAAVLAWQWWRGRRRQRRAWLAPILALSFAAAFSLYALRLTGDPLIWLHAREAVWADVGWRDPFRTVSRAFNQVDNRGLSVLGLLLLLAGAAYGAWQARAARAPGTLPAHVFTGILVLVHVVYAGTPSLLRYCLASFSVIWMLGHASRLGWPRILILALSLLVATWVAHWFAVWGPAF